MHEPSTSVGVSQSPVDGPTRSGSWASDPHRAARPVTSDASTYSASRTPLSRASTAPCPEASSTRSEPAVLRFADPVRISARTSPVDRRFFPRSARRRTSNRSPRWRGAARPHVRRQRRLILERATADRWSWSPDRGRRPEALVPLRQQRADERRLTRALCLNHDPGQPRVERQRGHAPARLRQATAGHGAEPLEQHERRRRAHRPTEGRTTRSDADLLPTRGSRAAGPARSTRCDVRLAVRAQPIGAHATAAGRGRAESPRPARPLVGGIQRDALGLQAVDRALRDRSAPLCAGRCPRPRSTPGTVSDVSAMLVARMTRGRRSGDRRVLRGGVEDPWSVDDVDAGRGAARTSAGARAISAAPGRKQQDAGRPCPAQRRRPRRRRRLAGGDSRSSTGCARPGTATTGQPPR